MRCEHCGLDPRALKQALDRERENVKTARQKLKRRDAEIALLRQDNESLKKELSNEHDSD